uniref:Uncharacterized protein n=1 Tax=Rhizophora mucronata TaxID=61149 RepID=A0A2P2Q735_RHIMU
MCFSFYFSSRKSLNFPWTGRFVRQF